MSRFDVLPEWTRRGSLHLDLHLDEGWLEEDGTAVEDLLRSVDAGSAEKYQMAVGDEDMTPIPVSFDSVSASEL